MRTRARRPAALLLFALLSSMPGRAEWDPTLVLTNGHLHIRVAPQIGRMVHLSGPDGVNVLRQDMDLLGKSEIPPGRWDWNNHGGDWLWPVTQDHWERLGVERRWPPPAIFEYAPWTGERLPGNRLSLRLELGAPLHVVLTRVWTFDPEDPAKLVIHQSIRRTAPSDVPVCLWQVAQMRDTKLVEMHVPPNTRHKMGFRHIQGPELPENAWNLTENTLRIQIPAASGAKLGTDGSRIIGRSPAGTLRLDVYKGEEPGELPDGGCSLALVVAHDSEYAELETMSVERRLNPGEEIRNRVVYHLSPPAPE